MPGAVDLDKAADFIWSNARLVERRLFANRFAGGTAEAVVTALRAYQNEDGGFGQALEADLRGPDSQPIHVDMAFRIMHECGAQAPEVVTRACSYLQSVASAAGGVPAIFPSVEGYPRAEHWEWEHWPAESVNPTAMIVGLLRAMRCGHAWLDVAEPFCWERLDGVTLDSGPALAAVYTFLNHAPDRRRAVTLAEKLAEQIPEAAFFTLQPVATDSYALTPLDLAPTPDAMARSLFADELIDAHLDVLESQQLADGGWTLTWDPPTDAAAVEWRGRVTVEALMTLQNYGRL